MSGVPLVSVVLPVFNAADYVAHAIDSILGQTLRDLELILIDDGSTDNSSEIMRGYASSDDRVHLVCRENRGLVATLNEGIALARGLWIARMDADDISLPQRLEKQLEWAERERADICGCWVQCFDGDNSLRRYPTDHLGCEAQLLFDVPLAHPAAIVRAKVFQSLKYDPDFADAEDYELWQRAWERGNKFTNIPEVLLNYRIHQGQISVRQRSRQEAVANVVRIRHWKSILTEFDESRIEELVFSIGRGFGDLTNLNPMFSALITKYDDGEAKEVVLYHLFRFYCKCAGVSKRAWVKWFVLVRDESWGHKYRGIMVLYSLRLLHVKGGGRLYSFLKKLYRRWIY